MTRDDWDDLGCLGRLRCQFADMKDTDYGQSL